MLLLIVDSPGQVERGGVLDAGIAGTACGEEYLAEAVECLGLTVMSADLAEQGLGPLEVADRVPVAALQSGHVAEVMQHAGFASAIVGAAVKS